MNVGWNAPGGDAASAAAGRSRGLVVLRAAVGVLIVVLLGVAGGAVAWGKHEQSSAREWRENSKKWEARVEPVDDRVTELEEKLAERNAELKKQQSRIQTLASEKAQLTDENRQLEEVARACVAF